MPGGQVEADLRRLAHAALVRRSRTGQENPLRDDCVDSRCLRCIVDARPMRSPPTSRRGAGRQLGIDVTAIVKLG